MRILVVNAGSSSLKLRLLGPGDQVLADSHVERWDGDPEHAAIGTFVSDVGPVDAVGHRIVHGGDRFLGPVLLDEDSIGAVAALTPLAPLHQPRALAGVRALQGLRPHVPAVGCFDTAFHARMPPQAATYAIPARWRQEWGVRRYGFHGLNHAWASRRAGELLGERPEPLRVIVAHLGAGASLCAVRGGQSMDTTMGFTPLEGLVMATRSGSVDPGLVLWLQHTSGLSAREVEDALEHHSGLLGLSGRSGDLRDVLAGCRAGDDSARLAYDVYVYRLRSFIAAMAAALGGLDALSFTAGVGEHSPDVRRDTLAGLAFLGLALDEDANEHVTSDADITAPGAAAATLVVTAREDLQIAAEVRAVLGASQA